MKNAKKTGIIRDVVWNFHMPTLFMGSDPFSKISEFLTIDE